MGLNETDLRIKSRLYGVTCGQVLYYLTHYYVPGDHAYITILVCRDYFAEQRGLTIVMMI